MSLGYCHCSAFNKIKHSHQEQLQSPQPNIVVYTFSSAKMNKLAAMNDPVATNDTTIMRDVYIAEHRNGTRALLLHLSGDLHSGQGRFDVILVVGKRIRRSLDHTHALKNEERIGSMERMLFKAQVLQLAEQQYATRADGWLTGTVEGMQEDGRFPEIVAAGGKESADGGGARDS